MPTKLFCPSCGTQNSTEQSYCRACGLSLDKAAESIADRFAPGEEANDHSQAVLDKFGTVAFTGLGIVVLCGIAWILYLIVARMILSGTQVAAGVLLAAFVVFAALGLAFVFAREMLGEKALAKKASRKSLAAPNKRPGLADPYFEPVPSVVENTTRELRVTNEVRRDQ